MEVYPVKSFELYDNFDNYTHIVTKLLEDPANSLGSIPVYTGDSQEPYRLLQKYNIPVNKTGTGGTEPGNYTYDTTFLKDTVNRYCQYREASGKQPGQCSDYVVLLGNFPQFSVPAVLFAAARDRELVTLDNFPDLLSWIEKHRPASITLIFPPEILDTASYPLLVEIMGGDAHGDAGDDTAEPNRFIPVMGILTGRNLAGVTWLVGKNLYNWDSYDQGLVLLPEVESGMPDYLGGKQIKFHSGADCLNADVFKKDTPDQIYKLFIAQGHGRVDGGIIDQGIICGQAPYIGRKIKENNGRFTGAGPQCAYGHGCYMDGPVAKACDIPAVHNILSVCSSGQLNDTIYEPDFVLGFSTVDGLSSTFVGNIRTFFAYRWEVPLFTQAARAGLTNGQVIRLLNSLQVRLNKDNPSFILVGDPLARVFPGTNDGPRAVEPEGDVFTVDTGGKTFFIAPIQLGNIEDPKPRPHTVYHVVPDTETHDPGINGLVCYMNRQPYAVFWGFPGNLPAEIRFSVTREPALDPGLEKQWEAAQTNFAQNHYHELMPMNIEERMDPISSLAKEIGSGLGASRYNLSIYREIKEKSATLARALDKSDEILLFDLIGKEDRAWPFDILIYIAYKLKSYKKSHRKCWCGRPLKRIELQPKMGIGQDWQVFTCLRCSEIITQPVNGFNVSWQGDDQGKTGSSVSHVLTLSHRFGRTVKGHFALEFSKRYGGNVTFNPGTVPFAIGPGESREFRIQMTLDGVKPHAYKLKAFIAYELQVEFLEKYLQVLPR